MSDGAALHFMKIAGLYSGIGGLELGFERVGFASRLLCEIDPTCGDVLRKRFPMTRLVGDISSLQSIPHVDVVTAGFPCTSFSQVGSTSGLAGGRSYIDHIFRLLDASSKVPAFLVFENVPFILHLDEGSAIRYIIGAVTERGYSWAYRVLDTNGFGLPQRRRRWIFVAARDVPAAAILFGGDRRTDRSDSPVPHAHGFYWTEGTRGIGWANDAIPPLKTGSSLGIPSPPAIWNRAEGLIFTPAIEDAERLQGFPPNWTRPTRLESHAERARWRLLGNAVSVPIAEWLARRILSASYRSPDGVEIGKDDRAPHAAYGNGREFVAVHASQRPSGHSTPPILQFLKYDGAPLSLRATRGFRARLEASTLRKDTEFIQALKKHERALVG